jgi:hypothetical protein
MRRGGANLAVAELGRLVETIERMSQVPRRVAVIAAPEITKLLQKQFATGTDPYGRPWRPLKPATLAKGRRPPPLTDSGAMRRGTVARAAPGGRAGIRLLVGKRYGFFHQSGTRYMAARRILPQNGLPYAWSRVLAEASKKAFREARR